MVLSFVSRNASLLKRKGIISEIPVIIVILFAFSVILLLMTRVLFDFRAGLEASGIEYVNQSLINSGFTALTSFDTIFIFILVGLLATDVILAYKARAHPIMFIFFVMLTAVFMVISVFFSNAFAAFGSTEQLGNMTVGYPVITTVMSNLPLLIMGVCFLLIVALFLNKRTDVGV